MRTITRATDLPGSDAQVVEVVGVYAIVELGRYRMVSQRPDGSTAMSNRLGAVTLDDGTWIGLGVRDDDEHALAGRRVRVRGTLMEAWPPRQPPHVAQPDPTPALLDITLVEPL
ncbi:MAG: hypothetical protein H0T79_03660 [Deltaproteobacteria bacterium]|nr:hypothetical protein [Deltaproteobacteria bacterium]